MKVILADKGGFPYFENLPHRKSYITTLWNGNIVDTQTEMKSNQEKYMANFFSETSENIKLEEWSEIYPDNQGTSLREVILSPASFEKGKYTNNFSYWNNVSYCKIIYDDGLTEYCYIVKRKCLNYPASQWKFTLSVDIYNTYWVDFIYPEIKKNSLPALIVRKTENRFSSVTYEGKKYWVMKKLVDQKNAFWNREKYNDNFKNVYSIKSGESIEPWNDDQIIRKSILELLFKKKYETFFAGENGFNLMVVINSSKAIFKAHAELKNFKKTLNNVYYAPVINYEAISSIGHLKDPTNFQKYFVYRIGSGAALNGGVANAVLETQSEVMWPYVISIIFTPKPPLMPNLTEGVYDDYVYEPRKGEKNTLELRNVGEIIYRSTDGSTTAERDLFIISKREKDKNDYGINEVTENILDNAMCDERIDLSGIVEKFLLNGTEKVIQESDDEKEPHLYGEDFLELEYSKATGNSFKISLVWYLFNNYRDLIKTKSLYILGYQFIQPNIVKLIQWVTEGLYKKFNDKTLSVFLETKFTPNLQMVQSKLQQFLLDNQSRMNAQMINSGVESASGMAGEFFNPALTLGKGSGAEKIDKLRSGIFGGLGIISSPFSLIETSIEQSAMRSDLARSQSGFKQGDGESSFKMVTASNGKYKINWINDLDKKRIADYYRQTGYMNGKLEKINNVATRIFYNFLQVGNFKVLLQGAKISIEYKEYFERLFLNGVTLWHDFQNSDGKLYNEIGDYTLENWETEIVGELK